MSYQEKLEDIIDKIEDIIEKELSTYTIDTLNDIVVELFLKNIFTSKDSIQNLIYELENIKENY